MIINKQTQLDDARASYHSLLTGTAARVIVDQNGERVEFVAANRGALYAYIQQLEGEIACSAVSCIQVRGPAGFFF